MQGRHELQTGDALIAAAVPLGPHLAVSIAIMNKELGLTHSKVKRLLQVLFDLTITRSTQDTQWKGSITGKRKQAGWSNDHLETLLLHITKR